MPSKISYQDTPSADKSNEARLVADKGVAEARTLRLEHNIQEFISKVDSVVFNVAEEDKEPWMTNWQQILLHGHINPQEDPD